MTARALLSTLPVKQVSLVGGGKKVYLDVRAPSKLSQLVLIMSLISPLGESHSGTVCIELALWCDCGEAASSSCYLLWEDLIVSEAGGAELSVTEEIQLSPRV